MDLERLISSLERFGKLLPALVADVTDEDARWKPESGNWSILEIIVHLADEESEDFRKRIELSLSDPDVVWPSIDPENAAVERRYNEKTLSVEVDRFVEERARSVSWLRLLQSPNWETTYDHASIGSFPIGDVMVGWAAHDHLHLKQIAKRLYEMNARDGAPYKPDYGGEWRA